MGLFSFLKSVGRKASNPTPSEPTKSVEQSASSSGLSHTIMLNYLKSTVTTSGIEVKDMNLELDEDKVTISGAVKSNEEREKIILMLGNVEGIASVEDNLTVEEPAQESVFCEVKKGDTLSKIAKEHYGSAGKYMVIFEANKPMLSDPDKIYPGQMLRIPPIS